jgi:hypothetical protein
VARAFLKIQFNLKTSPKPQLALRSKTVYLQRQLDPEQSAPEGLEFEASAKFL